MWTPSITRVEQNGENVSVTFLYTSDDNRTETIVEANVSDPNSLKQIAKSHIADLDRKDALLALVANPPLGVIDLLPMPPSDDEKALEDYNKGIFQLAELQKQLDLKQIDQQTFDDAAAAVKLTQPKSFSPLVPASIDATPLIP